MSFMGKQMANKIFILKQGEIAVSHQVTWLTGHNKISPNMELLIHEDKCQNIINKIILSGKDAQRKVHANIL